MSLLIRPIQPSDAPAAAHLSAQFGYPVDPAVMEQRIRGLDPSRAVFVACPEKACLEKACLEQEVLGWIDVSRAEHLQSGAYAEIGGLVVSEGARGQGIGAELVRAAEQWARERGLVKMLVRSQIARERAHSFYLREGYQRTKTSAVFTKSLG